MSTDVAVLGTYRSRAGRIEDSSLEEMIYEATRGALDQAAMTVQDIDAVVISGTDQVDGRVISCMVTVGAAAGVGKDVTTVASSGEHAFLYAYLRVLAGMGRRVLAVTWSKPSESVRPDHAELVAAEPFLLRPFGMNATVAAALQAAAYQAAHGTHPEIGPASAGQNGVSAVAVDTELPVAWPLLATDIAAGCDLACAAVLGTAEDAHGRDVAWIRGVGWATDRYDLGDRDLTRFASLETAAQQAYRAAGVRDPRHQIDVVEVTEISSVGALAAYEALGLAEYGKGGEVLSRARPVVNPPGGAARQGVSPGAPHAAGFDRFLRAADQVRGRAGAGQVQPKPAVSVGAALHGFAGQGASVVVFAADRNGGEHQ